MKKKDHGYLITVCLVGVLLLSLIAGSCAQPASGPAPAQPTTPTKPAQTVVLKYASYAPPTHLGTILAQEIFPMVETLTDGRVKVEVYHSESLVPVGETVDAVNRGVADIAFLPLPYLTGQMPWVRVTLIPGLVKGYEGAYNSFKYGLKDMVQESFKGLGLKVQILGVPFTPGFSLLMTKNKKISSPSDLKGMKIGCPSKGDIEIMTLLGASPVAMTGAENYEAMSRGVVDGCISNLGGFHGHKLYEPGDYILMYPMGCAMVAVLGSETGLAKLSPVDRAIVVSVAERRSLEEAFALAVSEGRYINQMTPGLKEMVYPTSEQAKQFSDLLAPILAGYLKQTGDQGQKAIDIIKKYNP